jgi:predicted RNA-binding Zn ribbon-like protein
MMEKFQLVAGHLALDFANTLDWRFDRERLVDLLPTYERFLAFAMQSGIISGKQASRLLERTSKPNALRALQRARDLREALDLLFRSIATGGSPPQSSLRTLNRFIKDSLIPESIVRRQSEFIRCSGDLSEKPDGPLWPLVDAAANLLTSPGRARVRECNEPSCRWLFLDSSKNQSRRWCNMKICGNRAKIKRFRARQRADG